MTPPPSVGLQPTLPFFLKNVPWLSGTIPAQRLAALRIVVGLTLLADILWTWLPSISDLFGPTGLTPWELFQFRFQSPHVSWSLLRILPATWGPITLVLIWLTSAIALIFGIKPNTAGATAWAISVSFHSANPYLNNSGDLLRNFALLIVAVAPTRWAWTLPPSCKLPHPRVASWPVAIIVLQLSCVYFISGIYKAMAPAWRAGDVMVNVMNDRNWSLVPGLAGEIPLWLHRISAWTTLGWELSFPILLLWPHTRKIALGLGIFFHLGTAFSMEVGLFPWWALALYIPLFPWERLPFGRTAAVIAAKSSSS